LDGGGVGDRGAERGDERKRKEREMKDETE
jgi:hypothetical protein